MRTIRTLFASLVAVVVALSAACTTSTPSSAGSTESPTTTTSTPAANAPSEDTVDAWEKRREAISLLMGVETMKSGSDSASFISITRSRDEIIWMYASNGVDADYVGVSFSSLDAIGGILYSTGEQKFATYQQCEATIPDYNCASSDEEEKERFNVPLAQFDSYARLVFGDAYQV